ncbi:RidA family protein [Cupriavidus necator]|uniref:RidA family protein n=1 Tax=Cupriavidus necator TaxID=106590 RepID=UPI002786E8AC|nr:RidA family protein [Cupriavidus necator]MDQ0141199.1 enamine deaminase RidA (YjgF/YER057c/UK114 family) [Cupriavidus necator]
MSAEQRVHELGLVLLSVPSPVGNFIPWRRHGDLLYLSGQGPRRADGSISVGKVGLDCTVEQAHADARLVGLQILATIRAAVGSLDRVECVVKLLGMVNAVPEFKDHPKVINGCSDLLIDVFGESGRHARSAVGMGSLPHGMTVEVEAIVALSPNL